uniref:Uncharacterized protein n=1 Tax=Tetraselmis sp. GSL018 TaxID=582737 RepID=A0A061SCF2_9CHLO
MSASALPLFICLLNFATAVKSLRDSIGEKNSRRLLSVEDIRELPQFTRIRTCAPINILVLTSSVEDALPYRAEIEAGKQEVIDALELVVDDQTLLVNFVDAEFTTFSAVKVTIFAPPESLLGVNVGGVAGNLVLVGFDLPIDFEASQRSVHEGGRGEVIVLVR